MVLLSDMSQDRYDQILCDSADLSLVLREIYDEARRTSMHLLACLHHTHTTLKPVRVRVQPLGEVV